MDDADPQRLWEEFEWQISEVYNIASTALDHPEERSALIHTPKKGPPQTLTYGELDRASDSLAQWFRSEGINTGDRIAVCLPQCPEHLIVHFAAYKVGAIMVPISMILGPEAVEYQLSNSGVRLFFIDTTRLAALENSVDDDDTLVPVEVGKFDADGAIDFHNQFGPLPTPPKAFETTKTAPDEPALILYTSGTGGHPKGVLQGHQYLLGSLPGFRCAYHIFKESDIMDARFWTPAEWAWAGALFDVVFPTLAMGGTVVSRVRRDGFDATDALEFIESEQVSHIFLPPTALQRIRDEGDLSSIDLSSLDVVMAGGEKLHPSLFEWSESALEVTTNETYGQTEANMLIGNTQRVFDAKPGSMGKPFPGHDIEIVDEEGNEVPPGEIGEIVLKGPDPVMLNEYWGDANKTAEKFLRKGWMRTGDLAKRDEDGYFWHAGRVDELIITSGYRVSPLEVESALSEDPRVSTAVVRGTPSATKGQNITAYVKLETDPDRSEPIKRELATKVRGQLGPHKTPDIIVIVESIPETRSGKLDRKSMRNPR